MRCFGAKRGVLERKGVFGGEKGCRGIMGAWGANGVL